MPVNGDTMDEPTPVELTNAVQRHRYVFLADAGDDEDSAWHVILTDKKQKGRPSSGPPNVHVTRDNMDALVASFSGERPIDVNHAHGKKDRSAENTRSRGWIKKLRRVGGALEAFIDWTTEGAELIRSKAFRYFSIEMNGARDKETGAVIWDTIKGGTLTNHPYYELPALTLSAEASALFEATNQARTDDAISAPPDRPAVEKEDPMEDLIVRLSKAEVHGDGDLTEDAAVELFGEIASLREEAGKVETLLAEKEALEASVATLTEASTADKGEIATLAERIGTLEVKASRAVEDAQFDKDMRRGAIDKAEAGSTEDPGIARRIYRQDVALYADSYGSRPDNAAHAGGKPAGHADSGKPKDCATTTIDDQDAAADHIDGAFTLHLADKPEDAQNYTDWLGAYVTKMDAEFAGEGTRLSNLMRFGTEA